MERTAAATRRLAGERALHLAARRRLGYGLAVALLAACLALGTAVGPVAIAPRDVARVLLNHVLGLDFAVPAVADAIIWQVRLPRVLLAGLVGATLAFSGAAYQGVFRNPLADPYLLGVASGAGLGATLLIVTDAPETAAGASLLPIAAFAGAIAAVLLTYAIARVAGHAPVTTLILAGVAVSAIAASAISYLMLTDRQNSLRVLSWLLGSFNDSAWRDLAYVLPYAVPAAGLIALHGRILNVLQLEEQEAQQLGVHVERTRLLLLGAASLATAAAVSVAGIIGFVGLVAPHAVRLVFGPDYRRLLPLAALAGASFLILADIGARTLVRPSEVPVGVVTSFVGAPFFLYLLRRQRRAYI